MSTSLKSRLLRTLVVLTASALLVGLYIAPFSKGGQGLPCPLLLLTGWQCPACGMTRAAVALLQGDLGAAFSCNALWLQGDLGAAFSCNALWPLYTAYLLWVVASDALLYVRRGEIRILPAPKWLHVLVLICAVGYGILRNFL